MTVLIVLLIILGFTAYQYLKGTLVKSVTTLFLLIFAAIVAFGFFEAVADIFIGRTTDYSRNALYDYIQPLTFVLLFVIAFSILQAVTSILTRKYVELGPLSEKIGRVVFGAISGLIVAGLILTALDMSVIKDNFPYERFNPGNPNPEKPNKAFLNADAFVTGTFNKLSRGSLSGKNSFAVIHPSLLDEAFLNRLGRDKEVTILTSKPAIELPQKAAAWPAPDKLINTEGQAVTPKTGHSLTIVRVGIKKNAVPFNPSQLRLVCNQKAVDKPLAGQGKNVYPIGYLKQANQLQQKKLTDKIDIEQSDFKEPVKWIDFVFNVPGNYEPVLVAFKQNNIAEVPKLVSAADAARTAPIETIKTPAEVKETIPEANDVNALP